MSLATTLDILNEAARGGYAVGAFNILNELTARAVVNCCSSLNAPVILQTSVSTVKQIGIQSLIGFLRPLAANAKIPVAIHLDHCQDIELAKSCVDAGWTSVMLDASHLPLSKNIAATREVVEYASPRGVSVEGELGAVSGVEDNISVAESEACLATVADSITYTSSTGIDLFAPAFGTAHGLYKGEPMLDFERFTQIMNAVSQPLVVHGGTGLAPQVFEKLIRLGATKINISTAIKLAYLGSIQEFLEQNPKNNNPLKLDAAVEAKIQETTAAHVKLFGSEGRSGCIKGGAL